MSGFIVVLAFLALFVLGFPVVLAIGIPCAVYMLANGLPLELIAQRTLYALDSFPLVAVPVFLFVGSLMNSAGISRYIYAFADTACGRLPGGLAQVNIFGSLIFAGMSGSALADIGGIGRIEIDAMRQKGFNAALRRRRDLGLGDRRADLPAEHPAHHLRHRHRRLGDPAPPRRHPARPPLRRRPDADDRLAGAAPRLSARRALADIRGAVARHGAGAAGDPRAGDPHRRHARRLLHPDRDRLGDGRLHGPDQRPVLPRAHRQGRARRRLRDDPRLGRHPPHRRRRGAVRLDPVGRAGAAGS